MFLRDASIYFSDSKLRGELNQMNQDENRWNVGHLLPTRGRTPIVKSQTFRTHIRAILSS